MVPDLLFSSLRLSVRAAGGRSAVSGLREMASLRQLIFKQAPEPNPLPELPLPVPEPSPAPTEKVVNPRPEGYQRRRVVSSGGDRYAPYRLLWVKVIIRAAYDFALWKDAKNINHRKFAEDARKWLFEPSELDFGLSSICEVWGFPIEKIRHYARNLTKEDVKKLEFKERQGRDLLHEPDPERVAANRP